MNERGFSSRWGLSLYVKRRVKPSYNEAQTEGFPAYDPQPHFRRPTPVAGGKSSREPLFQQSARLRDLLLYLTDRVLDGDVDEIHEQEVGVKVFGRPANYDTSSDNIVRVHASMLRKRLEQYFASEGADEPMVVEIRKGNYAPIFHARPEVEFVVEPSLAQAQADA